MRDAEVIATLSKLVQDRQSRGLSKYHAFLRRSHPEWNHKRIYRVYKAMKLDLRRAARRRLLKRDPGLPKVLHTDNGLEFLGEAFIQRAKADAMAIQYIQPGKPNQNAYIERFNRMFREEILGQHLFARLDDVREAAYGGRSRTTRSAHTNR